MQLVNVRFLDSALRSASGSCRIRIFGHTKESPRLEEALRQNRKLRRLEIDVRCHEAVAKALGQALKQSASLQSFILDASSTSMGDDTGLALAEALKQSASLQSFSLRASGSDMSDDTGLALQDALAVNFVVLAFAATGFCGVPPSVVEPVLLRNNDVLAQWKALVQLARCDAGSGLRSLKESSFRRELFSYAVPPVLAAKTRSFGVVFAGRRPSST